MFTCLLSVVVGVDPELDPTKNYSIKFLEQHLDSNNFYHKKGLKTLCNCLLYFHNSLKIKRRLIEKL